MKRMGIFVKNVASAYFCYYNRVGHEYGWGRVSSHISKCTVQEGLYLTHFSKTEMSYAVILVLSLWQLSSSVV